MVHDRITNYGNSERFDIEEAPFSPYMIHATGGTPAYIDPNNGLPSRKVNILYYIILKNSKIYCTLFQY